MNANLFRPSLVRTSLCLLVLLAGIQAQARQPPDAAAGHGAPSPQALAEQPQTDALGVGEIQIRFGQTLWSIASAAKPPNYEKVQQYMFAILAENPDSFHGGNINGLIAGSRLRLPSAESAAAFAISPQEAIRETKAQNAAWLSGALNILDEEASKVVARAGEASVDVGATPAEPGRTGWAATGRPPAAASVASRPGEDAPLSADASASSALAEDALADLRRQMQQHLRRLDAQDREVASLAADLSALRTRLSRQQKTWMAEVTLWRRIAGGVAIAALALLGAAVWALRRKRPLRAADDGAVARDLPPKGADASLAPSEGDPASAGSKGPPDDPVSGPMADQRVKLNLARANISLGKLAVAREILDEVLAQGSESAQQEARTLLNDISDQGNQPSKD